MFDFILLRHEDFSGWPNGAEDILSESDDLFYRQKIVAGHAAYTQGIQIVRPIRSQPEIFSSMKDDWFGRRDKRYVEFMTHDWRNNILTKISTDPTATTNYFEATKNYLPFELSPAFFHSEVRSKYN
jgi:hypothetical protein